MFNNGNRLDKALMLGSPIVNAENLAASLSLVVWLCDIAL